MATKKITKVPEFLRDIDTSSFERFQETAGIDMWQLAYDYNTVSFRYEDGAKLLWQPGFYNADEDEKVLMIMYNPYSRKGTKEFVSQIVYAEETGSLWSATLMIDFESHPDARYDMRLGRFTEPSWSKPVVRSFSVSSWTLVKKFENYFGTIQSKSEIEQIIKDSNPYAYQWLKQRGYDYYRYLMAPYLETLVKAGYRFADRFLKEGGSYYDSYRKRLKAPAQWDKSYIDALNRLCQNGTNPKEIFKMSPILFKALKDEQDILIWDEFRKLDKRISNPVAIKRLLDMDISRDRVKYICEILKKEYHDKPVLSVDALQKYLTRVDVYEAIGLDEALPLIRDYIVSCINIDKKPIFTGDSLKREHDVTVRMNRDYRNETYSPKIVTVGHKLEKYGYQEDTFFIRPIRDYDDLNDESMQQGNCLSAVYPARIANERSYVFVMREKKAPEKSLATVEVNHDASGLSLGQHLLSHNRPITNKSQLGFIKRWMKHVQSVFAADTTTC